jgi:hypothetical protein
MTVIPEHGWYIQRDTSDVYDAPHRLWINGKYVAWLTTEQADAFPTEPEAAPPLPSERPDTDVGQLRELADWFDKVDAWRGVTDRNEVQDDLRRIADSLHEPEQLPDGIRAGYLLDPREPVPEGWERRCPNDIWATGWNISLTPAEARRIPVPPAPATERVPWYEATDRMVPTGAVIDKIVTTAEDVRCFSPNGAWLCDPDLDGTVEVLVEDS